MSATDTEIVICSFPKADNPEDHFCCCINHTISICGKELENDPVDSYPDSVECQECDDKAWDNHCPLLGPNMCKHRWEEIP